MKFKERGYFNWLWPMILLTFTTLLGCSTEQELAMPTVQIEQSRSTVEAVETSATVQVQPDNTPSLTKNGPEIRAIWVQCKTTNSPKKVIEMLDQVTRGGFDTIFYCVGSWSVNYDSKLLQARSDIEAGFDALEYVVEQAHARGFKVQAWFSPGLLMWDGNLREIHPEWDIASLEGIEADFHWTNFSIPEVRQFVGDAVMEIAQNYDIDGIHLDYIRYPYQLYPGEIEDREVFSADDVSTTVKNIYQRLKSVKPNIPLTAAVMAYGGQYHLQNWDEWLAGGYIDYVVTMAYHAPNKNDELQQDIDNWQTLSRPERIVPGLSVVIDFTTPTIEIKTPEQLLTQIELIQNRSTKSFSIFDEAHITVELLDALAAKVD